MVLNRCKFLKIILHVCGITGFQCHCMADPYLCSNYDEDADRPCVQGYGSKDFDEGKDLAKIAQVESERTSMEVESFTNYADRIQDELLEIYRIKSERIEIIEEHGEEASEVPDWF